jgi:hypothetical protein
VFVFGDVATKLLYMIQPKDTETTHADGALVRLNMIVLESITHLARLGRCKEHIDNIRLLAELELDPEGTCTIAGLPADS